MLQFVQLRMYFRINLVVAVPNAHRKDAAKEIEVLVAISVPDKLILARSTTSGSLK